MSELARGESHNINDAITFKVTDKGREVIAQHFASLIETAPDGIHKDIQAVADRTVAEDGSVTLSIWEMAELLGPHLYNGSPNLIENNSFTFLKPTASQE